MARRASGNKTARRWLLFGVLVAVPLGWFVGAWLSFPSDHTPEGAYLRVVKAVNRDEPREFFAYIDEEAQHASFTIGDYRSKALEVARRTYPPAELSRLEKEYGAVARAERGPGVFAYFAREEGWMSQLRRDLSGIERVERDGKRATVVTVRGTRYSFRERPNGIYGLTAFTATLSEEAERAARDLELVEQAARDYERVRARAE